ASTVATWTNSGCCDSATAVGAWRVGVDTASAADEARVIDRIAALDSVALDSVGLPASATLARLSREDLPRCSILLSDGRSVAALTWGRPLGLTEIDRWEYAVTSEPTSGSAWTPLPSGTLIDLADCGPTVFSLPCPHAAKEPA